jgi:hypothetical protein
VTEQLDFSWVYELTPLATFRMVTRLERLTEEARHLEHQQHSILELRERDGVFRYVAQRQLDVETGTRARLFSGPPMLKFTQIWHAPDWDGSRNYDLTGEISGMSSRILGKGRLVPVESSQARLSLSLTIDATGRLGGRKYEAGIAASLSHTLEAEHDFRLAWLDRQGHNAF